ncbi:DLK1 isoform 4 [Pongo abelii]|uniref:DLK1 isoform 4 n=1 Tax=Pongo abelii TaxID=9601 RepID=A0A2J8T003_PONAB|nr:DLK1 isoform 4 [Pongo abelii]
MTATEALLRVLLLLLAFGHSTYGAECFPACNPQNGFCEDDNVCRCQPGWQGPLCDQCMTSPGCLHGLCEEPGQCICTDGWDGELCDRGWHLPLFTSALRPYLPALAPTTSSQSPVAGVPHFLIPAHLVPCILKICL